MEALTLGQSGGGLLDLGFFLALLALDFFAVAKIITKAGYSSKWILVPLAPVLLWFVTFLLLAFDVRHLVVGGATLSVPVSLSNLRILQILDLLSVVVTWVFFLIFAFSPWPTSGDRNGRPAFAAAPSASVNAGLPVSRVPNAAGGASAQVMTLPTSMARNEPETSGPQPPDAQKVIYCSWCGKSRESNAQAIHHCGSLERPAAYCMQCGTPLETGAAVCAACGTPSSTLSR
jgi:hypothetical protein